MRAAISRIRRWMKSVFFCGQPIREGDAGFILPHFGEGERWTERASHRGCFLESI